MLDYFIGNKNSINLRSYQLSNNKPICDEKEEIVQWDNWDEEFQNKNLNDDLTKTSKNKYNTF